jgi:hypothetical protein
MIRRVIPLWGLLICGTCGCLGDQPTLLVPDRPFSASQAPVSRSAYEAPKDVAVAARVDKLGRELLAANPEVGARPMFRTIGAPQPEIFHHGTAEIYISEGLVKQCPTEGTLAALLCVELGRMVAEREAMASPRVWECDQPPPPDAPVGNDVGSFQGAADRTRLAELAHYRPPVRRPTPPPLADPESLARVYLQKANFPPDDLDAAAPLLKLAAGSSTLEKSVVNPAPAAPLTK